MTTRFAALAFVAILFVASGCSKSGQSASSANGSMPASASNSDAGAAAPSASFPGVSSSDAAAIRAAIQDHLQGNQGINMGAMEMTLDSITINANQAQARTSFHIKNGTTGMVMNYFLQRSGSGWVVTKGQPADGNTTLPPSVSPHPGANSGQDSQGALPDVNAFFKDHPAPKSN